MKIHLASSKPMRQNGEAIVGSIQPKRRTISIAGIAVKVFPIMEHGKKLLAVRRCHDFGRLALQ